jgi:biopolymer transport protein TolR
MAFGGGGGQGGQKNEINVTPLVDVVLVLLIIFMVVTPMLQRGKDVTLPKAKNIEQETKEKIKKDALILSITPDKKIYFDKDEMDDENMKKRLSDELLASPGRPILLKGDQSLEFGDVKRVLNLAREAKADRVSLGVEELKE